MTKYNVGDIVRVRSDFAAEEYGMDPDADILVGKEVEIIWAHEDGEGEASYHIKEDSADWFWGNDCFDPIEPVVGECIAIDDDWNITSKKIDKIAEQYEPTRSMKEPGTLTEDKINQYKQEQADVAKFDKVTKPSHYTDGAIETIDFIRDKQTKEEFVGFCTGNVMKYISRWRKKGGVEDLEKAKVYLNWAIKGASADGE